MIFPHSQGAHSANSVASANCYYYRSSFQDRNGKTLQTNADDSPRSTNGTPAETAADAIPHDKMHTRETRGENTSYAEFTELEWLRCGKDLFVWLYNNYNNYGSWIEIEKLTSFKD